MWDVLLTLFILYHITVWALRKLRLSDYGNRHVFITGCDTGFGHLVALKLDDLGFHVFASCLTDDGASNLKKKSSENLRTVILDITNEQDIANAVSVVKNNLPTGQGLWGLVNNAGVYGVFGFAELHTHADYQRALDINLLGLVDVTQAFLPLVRQATGRIVNVASAAGRLAVPCSAPYTISKYGVEAYSDSLRREINIFGVTVHIIEPGCFSTEMLKGMVGAQSKAGCMASFDMARPDVQAAYGREYVIASCDSAQSSIAKLASKDTYKVADAMVHALTARFPKYRYPVGFDAYATIFMSMLPEWVFDSMISFGSKKLFKETHQKDKQS